ncbi:hypothetical protein, partial [Xanthomonas graminis]|uniref:hypothetical protein n=4 Tax=Xanthomonas graminis TaxID=3390026 RepID=UPI001F3A9989
MILDVENRVHHFHSLKKEFLGSLLMSEATSGNDNFLQKISSLCSRHYLPTLDGMPLDRVDRTRTSAEIEVLKNFSPLINEIPQRLRFPHFFKLRTACSDWPPVATDVARGAWRGG